MSWSIQNKVSFALKTVINIYRIRCGNKYPTTSQSQLSITNAAGRYWNLFTGTCKYWLSNKPQHLLSLGRVRSIKVDRWRRTSTRVTTNQLLHFLKVTWYDRPKQMCRSICISPYSMEGDVNLNSKWTLIIIIQLMSGADVMMPVSLVLISFITISIVYFSVLYKA